MYKKEAATTSLANLLDPASSIDLVHTVYHVQRLHGEGQPTSIKRFGLNVSVPESVQHLRQGGAFAPAGVRVVMTKVVGPNTKAVSTGSSRKVGRNDPCSCGSGKKYKRCYVSRGPAPSSRLPVDDAEGDEQPSSQEFQELQRTFLDVALVAAGRAGSLRRLPKARGDLR